MQSHFHEHVSRSLLKTVTFRVVVVCSDIIIAFAVTKKIDLTFYIIASTNLASTVLYFLHERAWNKIGYGKKHITVGAQPSENQVIS